MSQQERDEADKAQEEFKNSVKKAYEFLRGHDDFDEDRIVMGLMKTLLDSIEEYQDEAEKE